MSLELELRDNNLYQNGRIIQFDDGQQEIERDTIVFNQIGSTTIGAEDDFYYTLKGGDELTKLAYKFYGDLVEDSGKYWWLIADANEIENPLDLIDFVGKEILIPSILNFKLRNG